MATFWSYARRLAATFSSRGASSRRRRRQQPRRFSPLRGLERLEDRVVPDVTALLPGSMFTSEGPQQTSGAPAPSLVTSPSAIAGAITGIAINSLAPMNKIVYVGTANGGVWQTLDINAMVGGNNSPTWTPRTDTQASLSISALAFDAVASKAAYGTATVDGSKDVVYAGTGSVSAAAGAAGPAIGLLKTTDGGATWSVKGYNELAGLKITAIVATQFRDANGLHPVLLVSTRANDVDTLHGDAADVGVWRSTDGGDTWAHVSDPVVGASVSGLAAGDVTDLKAVRDPADSANPGSFLIYAANIGIAGGTGAGVYESADGGVTWKNVTTKSDGTTNIAGTADFTATGGPYSLPAVQPFWIKLAVYASPPTAAPQTTRVYAGITDANKLKRVIYWDRGATPWQSLLDTPASLEGSPATLWGLFDDPGQANIHFSLAADPTTANKIFMGGDTQPVLPASTGITRYLARVFRVDAATNYSNNIQMGQARGDLLIGNNASNTSPHADSRLIVFDPAGNMYEGDDGGLFRLMNPEGVGGAPMWVSLNGNLQISEVGSVAYDPQNRRVIIGAQDNGVQEENLPGPTAPGSTPSPWTSFSGGDGSTVQVAVEGTTTYVYSVSNEFQFLQRRAFDANGVQLPNGPTLTKTSGLLSNMDPADRNQFLGSHALAVNAVNPVKLLAGVFDLWESNNRGNSVDPTPIDDTMGSAATGGLLTALAYGGTNPDGTANEQVIYRARLNFLRAFDGANWNPTEFDAGAGTVITGIALDPRNWQRAYAVGNDDANNVKVFVTIDGGNNWTDITADAMKATGLPKAPLQAVQLIPTESPDLHFHLHSGKDYDVTLRGANTIGDIQTRIQQQTQNNVRVEINSPATGQVQLKLVDRTPFSISTALTYASNPFSVTAVGSSPALAELGLDKSASGLGAGSELVGKTFQAPAGTPAAVSLADVTNATGTRGIHANPNDQDVLLVGGNQGLYRLINPVGDPSVLGTGKYPVLPTPATAAQFQLTIPGPNNDLLVTAKQPGADLNKVTVSLLNHGATGPARVSWDPVTQNLVFDLPSTATAKDVITLVNGPDVTSVPMTATDSATTGQLLTTTPPVPYQYKVSFVSATGVEGNLSAPVPVTVTGDYHSVQLAQIPTGPAGTLARRIYRTAAGTSTFDLVGTLNDNTTTTFTDFTPDRLQATAPSVAGAGTTATDGGTGGKLAAGTYRYRFSFVDNLGVESQLSDVVTLPKDSSGNPIPLAANHFINLANIPTGPTGTVARRIYRALSTDDTFTLVGTLNDNTTFTFADRLGTPVDVTTTDPTRPAKPTGITATVSAGGRLAVGPYKYRVTILDATGVESNASDELTGTTTAGNQTIKLAGIAARTVAGNIVRIYRTQAGGTTYNLIATLTDPSATQFFDTGTLGFDPTLVKDASRPTAPNITSGAVASGVTGTLAKGTYSYRVTYLDANGVESNVSAVQTVPVANDNSQVALTIPAAPTGAKGRRIYRSDAAGNPYVLVGTINDNTTTAFADSGAVRDPSAAAVGAAFRLANFNGDNGTGTMDQIASGQLTGGTAGVLGTAASVTIVNAMLNNDLKVTAKNSGTQYNGVNVAFVANPDRAKLNELVSWSAADRLLVFEISTTSQAIDLVSAMNLAQNKAASDLFKVALATPDNPSGSNGGVGTIPGATVLNRVGGQAALQWTRFGSNLPNALVSAMTYSSQNDVLVVGLRGRGAWELNKASTFLTQKSILQLTANGDRVVLQLDPSQPADLAQVLQVYQQNDPNGPKTLKGTFPLAGIQQIKVTGAAGNDTLVVDPRIRVPGGIVFDGVSGTDTLELPASPGQLLVQKFNAGGMGTLQVDNPADLKDPGLQINFVNTQQVKSGLLAGQTATPPGDLKSQLAQIRNGLTFVTAPGTLNDALATGLGKLPLIGTAVTDLLNGVLGPPSRGALADNPGEGGGGGGAANKPTSPVLSLLLGTASKTFSLSDLGTTITTLDALRQALDRLDNTPNNVTLTTTPAGFTYDMTIARTVTGTAPVSLSVGTGSVALTSNATISADVTLHLKFGVDRNGFFVDTTPANELTITNVKVLNAGAADTTGRFGLLGVSGTGTSLTLTVDPGVTFTADLKEPDPDPFTNVPDNFLRTGELIATPATLFTFAQANPTGGKPAVTLKGTLNPAGLVPGGPAPFALAGKVTLTWADITHMETVSAGATDTSPDAATVTFLLFQKLTAQPIVTDLTRANDGAAAVFQAKSQVDVLKNANVPLTTKNLYDVLNKDTATLTFQGDAVQFQGALTTDDKGKHFSIGFKGDNALTTAQYGIKKGDSVQFAADDGSLITGTVESLDLDTVTINYPSTIKGSDSVQFAESRLPDKAHPFFKFSRSGKLADQFLTALGSNLTNDVYVKANVLTLQDIIREVAMAEGEDLSSGTLTPVTVDTTAKTVTITPTFRPAPLQYNEPLSLASTAPNNALGWLSFDPTGTFPVTLTTQIRVPVVVKLDVSPSTDDSVFVAVDGIPDVEYHLDEALSNLSARSLIGAVLKKDPSAASNGGITASLDYKLTLLDPATDGDNRASLTELKGTLSDANKAIFQTGVQGSLNIPGLVIQPEVATGNGAVSFTPIKIFTTSGTAQDPRSPVQVSNLADLTNLPKKIFATGTATVPASYQFTFAPPDVAVSNVTVSPSGQATVTGTANFSALDLSGATVGVYYDTSTTGFHGTLIATVPASQATNFSVTLGNFATLASQPYYFYAVARDGINAPVYSDYFGPVTPPDLRPVLTVPAPQTSTFASPVTFSGANAIKVDAGGTTLPTASVTITALFGTVKLGSGPAMTSITVAGDALNSGTVTYTPPASPTGFPGYDVLSVTATRSFSDNKGLVFTSPTSLIPINPAGNAADLSVTTAFKDMSGNDVSYVLPGDQIQIQLTVTNSNTFAGTANATNVKVTDALPFGVTLVSPAPVGFDPATGIWTVGTVNAGNKANLTLNATVRTDLPLDQLVNTATVTADQKDFQPANNQASATIPVPRLVTVDNAAMDETTANDNKVSLREAIQQANADPAHNYVLKLPAAFSLTLGSGALPTVTGSITIVGAATAAGAATYSISANNASRIFDVGAGGSLALSGVTLTSGKVTGNQNGGAIQNAGNLTLTNVTISMSSSEQDGGAIYNTGALLLTQSTLSSNTSMANGGAVSSKGGSFTMTGKDTTVDGNTAKLSGGGLYLQDLSDSITGGTIKNNKAKGTDATSPGGTAQVAYGGGAVVKNGRVTITNTTFMKNTAPIGGALEVFSKDPNNPAVVDLSGDTFTGNMATGDFNTTTNRGGALAIYNGSLVRVDSSTFSGNGAKNDKRPTGTSDTSKAGAVYNGVGSTLIITRSTFSGNTAPRQSGAIDNPGTLLVTESTFANNTTAGFGGAIDTKGRATVKSSTFSGNTATGGGGGIALFSTTTQDGTLYLGSSIVAGNTRGSDTTPSDVSVFLSTNFAPKKGLLGGAVRSLGYNLIRLGATSIAWKDSDEVGTASDLLDPMLGPLQDNGGTTKTFTMAPQAGSPAIDAGNPNPGDATDQRGLPRIDVVGSASDIGAVETTLTAGGSGSTGSSGPKSSEPPSDPGDSGTGTAPSDPPFVEGTPGTLTQAFTDTVSPADASAYTVSVDWGDGSPVSTGADVTFTGTAGTYTLTATHTYADEGSFNIVVTISKDGVDHTLPLVATVADADALAPDPNSPVSVPGVEGTNLDQVVVARFDNPGFPANTTDEFTARIDWGDKAVTSGTVRRVDPPAGSGQSPYYEVVGSHRYTEDDTYPVNVSVFDDPAGPPLVIPVSLVIAEDPNFAVTNAPAITTADGTPTGAPLVEGTQMNNILLATFRHANGVEPASDFVATIDWGDGSTSDSTGTVTLVTPADPTQAPYYEVRGSHVYAEDRTWPISVTIQDTQDTEVEPNSPPVTASTTAVVGEDPTFTTTGGQALHANAGDYLANVKLATFQHSDGWEDPTNDFKVTIDWGDGTPGSDPSAVGTVQEDDVTGIYTVFGSHVYTAPSGATPYKIKVTITDVSSTDDLAAAPPIQAVVSDDTATVAASQAPTFTSPAQATFTVGTAGSFTVTTKGAPNAAITETDNLPAGSQISFQDKHDGTATLAGTPAAGTGGTYTFHLTANNGVAPNATQDLALTVNEATTITSPAQVTFTGGVPGSFTVTTRGFPAKATLTETDNLPAGSRITFRDNGDGTATIAGIPRNSSAGKYQLNITAGNGIGAPATQNFTVTIALGDLNRGFVQSLYLDVLNRAGSADEINAWVQAIAAGVTRNSVAKAFWESSEHRRLEVDGYYVTYLHRPAGPNEDTGWVAMFLGGATERDVIQGFVTSREYLSTRKGDVEFVTGLYKDVLGRSAQPDEVTAWLNALDAGVSRAQVAVDFLDSPEWADHVTSGLYLSLLKRQAGPGEVAAWRQALSFGTTVTSIAELLLSSDEYFSKT